MTDTSPLINNSVVITSDLNYNLKPSAVRSRSYRGSIMPTNKSTFSPSDTCIIYIPGGRRNTYLDTKQTYARFTVRQTSVPGNETMYLDGSANSVINRIDIFHGGNLLESIQGYNILSSYILDMQLTVSDRLGLSPLFGFDPVGGRGGDSLVTAAVANATQQQTYCVPIFSGVMGVLADKCLPIGLLADDLRIEITFETQILGVVGTNTTLYTITDFQLQLCIIELSDEGDAMVRETASADQPVYLHGSSWKRYTSQLPVTSGAYSTLIPARFASLKQITLLPRRSVDQVVDRYSLSSRVNPNFDSYNFRIGTSLVPSKPVVLANAGTTGGYAEAYAELLKAWHGLNVVGVAPSLGEYHGRSDMAAVATIGGVTQGINTAANTFQNAFAIAQEFESFAQRSDVLMSGMNTLSSQVFFEATISTAPGAAYSLDFFAWYDHILVLERGILSVKL